MRVTAWSYSRLAKFELCPLQFKLSAIDKIPEPQSPAMQRGNDMHVAIAKYLTGKADSLPQDTMQHVRIVSLIKEIRDFPDKVVEQQWGFTNTWEPCGWFGGATWFRQVLDVGVLYEDLTAEAVDWKSGKRYGTNDDQMELQALSVMHKYKPVRSVTTRLAYIDSGDEEFAEFPTRDKEKLTDKWNKRASKLLSAEVFPPKPNDKCRFCNFSRSKGGQCAFG